MATRETKWLVRALVALAKKELAEANANREEENDWPAGQEWNDLAGSSQHAFMRAAREGAGIPHDEYREFIDGVVDGELDELWEELDSP